MLKIENLSKSYGDVHALNNVTLNIRPGLFGLLGANGAGKTTLMNMVATLTAPTGGTISFNEIDAEQSPMRMRQVVGYLPQDFGVYPSESAVEMLDYFARLKGFSDSQERTAHINELLALVNLSEVKHRAVDTYSGGMKRRFGVAQALIGWPPIVIVDEPTAGLDPIERNRFQQILAGFGDRAIVILSTHIIEDIDNICSMAGVMHEGRLVCSGAPDDLIGKLRGKVWRVAGEGEEFKSRGFQVLATRPFRGQLYSYLLADTNPGDGFTPYEPNLDDVFFAARTSYFA